MTANSDDPAYFGGYMNDNYDAVATSLGLTRSDLVSIARNSFTAAMMSDQDRRAALGQFDAAAADETATGR